MTLTPYMKLDLPIVGVTTGPDYATLLVDALEAIDSHNHTTNSGKKITSAAINIDDNLSFNSKSLTSLLKTAFSSQSSSLTGSTNKNSIYVLNGEMVFIDNNGTAVQITSAGNINVSGLAGNISGMTGTTAAVTYSNVAKTFIFTQDAGIAAHCQLGNLLLQESSGSDTITVKAPASVSSSYTITLPSAAPTASYSFLQFNTSGVANWLTLAISGLAYISYSAGTFTLAQIVPSTDISVSGATTGQSLRYTGTACGYQNDTKIEGTLLSPTTVASSGTVTMPSGNRHCLTFLGGNGGAVTSVVLSNGSWTGQHWTIHGTSNTNTVDFDVSTINMNGHMILGLNDTIEFMWNGTTWTEVSRSN